MIWLRYSLQGLLVFDGDKLLVTDNKTLVEAAKRNTSKYNAVPLFYNMGKAKAELLTPESLFKGLMLAFTGGNIGAPSNDITKIWNSGEITDEALTVIKWLVMEVNYIIDYAKTLYKPERPEWANKIIMKYTKEKLPSFFMYAKKKLPKQVKLISHCTVDRIKTLYPKRHLNYNFKQDNIGKFDYKVLMSNTDTEIYDEIAEKFTEVTSNLNFNNVSDEKMFSYLATYAMAKNEILSMNYSEDVIIDNIVYNLFKVRKTDKKKAFWTLFGDEVYENISKNISDDFVVCKRCQKRFLRSRVTQVYCDRCQGYQKKSVKIIICCDCGEEFETSSKANKKKRCDKCQKEYIKAYDRMRKS